MAAWIKSADRDHYKGVWQLVSHYSSFILGTDGWDNDRVCFIIHDGSWRYGSCYRVRDPGNWHHFVGTFNRAGPNNQRKKLYVDGILRDQNNAGGNRRLRNDGGPIDLGHRECCNHGNFNGWMDEVMIYDRALSQGEITELYESYSGRIQ